MEEPSVPRLFTGPDRPRRQLSGKVVAEGKALASNSLCVAGRDAAGPCAGAIGASETEHSGRLFIWAFMMWFFGRQVFVPPPNLLIHRPRHIGQDARPIHNRPPPALS